MFKEILVVGLGLLIYAGGVLNGRFYERRLWRAEEESRQAQQKPAP